MMTDANAAYNKGWADAMAGWGPVAPYKTDALNDAYNDGYLAANRIKDDQEAE